MDADELKLVVEKRTINQAANTVEQIRLTVAELIKGPTLELIPTIPEETRVRTVFLDEKGCAYVDFSRDISQKHPGGTTGELVTISSIVNTLAMNLAWCIWFSCITDTGLSPIKFSWEFKLFIARFTDFIIAGIFFSYSLAEAWETTSPLGTEYKLSILNLHILKFNGHYKLEVLGRLLAQGSPANRITFAPADNSVGWQGLRFYNVAAATNDTSKVEYCLIRHGRATGTGSYETYGSVSRISCCTSCARF